MKVIAHLSSLMFLLLLFSCSNKIGDLVDSLENDIIVESKLSAKLIDEIVKRPQKKVQIYSNPFAEIKDKEGNTLYAFFKDEEVIYEGDYLDAWSDRMQDRSSLCYPLKLSDIHELIRISNSCSQ